MIWGGAQQELGQLEIVENTGLEFGRAYRTRLDRIADARWNVQLAGTINAPIRDGHVYLLSFHARCLRSTTGDGGLHVKLERNGPDWASRISRRVNFGREWTRFDLPFAVGRGEEFAAGESRLTFHLGSDLQTIEVGGIVLRDFADRVPLASLPRTEVTYDGRGADAAWRELADQRINQHRKAQLTIRVTDIHGKPIPNATVRVKQQRHAFVFGTAMNLNFATSDRPEVETYKQKLLERFNAVVFENALKWKGNDPWGLRNPAAVEAGIAFTQEHDLYVRGHTLVWPGTRHMPSHINDLIAQLRSDPEDQEARAQLHQAVEDRITQTSSYLAGRVEEWDVVNEPFTNHALMDVLDPPGTPHGSGVMASWFGLAKSHAPDARLFLNDYGILTAGNRWSPHQQHFFDTAQQLLEAGAPLEGLGMQGHFGATLTSPSRLWAILDRYAQLGLPIKVTEFDVNIDDPQVLADYTRDFTTAVFAHPSVDGLLTWGFWAGAHWKPQAAHLNPDFTSRPHDLVLQDLLFNQWWTEEVVTTDSMGGAQLRAFKGDYEIGVEAPNHMTHLALIKSFMDDQTISVTLKTND
ncbi:MAG: endo-1,4-beta-xylanase [Planctomycetota bacterium]